MNVLLAVDNSPTSQAALAATLAREWPEETEFRVLTVLPARERPYREPDAISTELYSAHKLLDTAISKIQAFNPFSIVMGQIEVGDPAKCIIRLAESWPADLIVAGSQKRGAIGHFFSKSVSRCILQEANASVFIARNIEAPAEFNRVLVVVDETFGAKIAIDSVLKTRWPKDTQFMLVSPANLDYGVYSFQPSGAAYLGAIELHQEYLQGLRESLERLKRSLEKQFGPGCVQHAVREGNAAQVVLSVAKEWNAQLIVVGTGERTGLPLKVFGSLAQTLSLKAPCSVQVARWPVAPLSSRIDAARNSHNLRLVNF